MCENIVHNNRINYCNSLLSRFQPLCMFPFKCIVLHCVSTSGVAPPSFREKSLHLSIQHIYLCPIVPSFCCTKIIAEHNSIVFRRKCDFKAHIIQLHYYMHKMGRAAEAFCQKERKIESYTTITFLHFFVFCRLFKYI